MNFHQKRSPEYYLNKAFQIYQTNPHQITVPHKYYETLNKMYNHIPIKCPRANKLDSEYLNHKIR